MGARGRDVHHMNDGSQVAQSMPWRCSVSSADTSDTDAKRWWDLDKGSEAATEASLRTMLMRGRSGQNSSHRCEALENHEVVVVCMRLMGEQGRMVGVWRWQNSTVAGWMG